MSSQTRSSVGCPIFGAPTQLPQSQLPTVCDVLRYYQAVRYEKKIDAREPSSTEIVKQVANEVVSIWNRASLAPSSTNSIQEVIRKIGDLHEKHEKRVKQFLRRQGGGSEASDALREIAEYRIHQKSTLFDISSCKCKEFESCRCPPSKRVPVLERGFLSDQRTVRMMHIDRIDRKVTAKNERRQKRIEKEEARSQRHLASTLAINDVEMSQGEDEGEDSESEQEEDDDDDDFRPIEYDDEAKRRPDVNLTLYAIECDRVGLSDMASARLLNAMMATFGIIDEDNTTAVVDRNKMRREKAKARALVTSWNIEKHQRPKCIYFDGKKDATKVQELRGNRLHPTTVREDHYVMVAPDGAFIGHLTVPKKEDVGGKEAQRILLEMIHFFEQNDIEVTELEALGCDGTAVNTGIHGGVLTRMEQFLGRPIQRIVCLLHTNELPFRHLFKYIDGETTGPTSFSGEIGKLLPSAHTMPVTAYIRISVDNFPFIDPSIVKDLSPDQKYLYDISSLIRGTAEDDQVVNRLPGPINHSRWLTCACRILRLYIATDQTKPYYANLHALTEFILKCYAPVWFLVKSRPYIKDAAKHYFQMVKRSRYLPDDQRKVVDRYLKINYYAGHSESVLLSMLGDDSKRETAIQIIENVRRERPGDYQWVNSEERFEMMDVDGEEKEEVQIRKYRQPNLSFAHITSASTDDEYDSLLDFSQINSITESPLTMSIPLDQLTNFPIPDYPGHTQAAERCIKLVTDASQKVIGKEKRHGCIVNTQFSRSVNGEFQSKRDYKVADIREILKTKASQKRRRQE